MLKKVEAESLDVQPYHEWVDGETLEELDGLADRLAGLKVGHVNVTSRGGGGVVLCVNDTQLSTLSTQLFAISFWRK